MPVKVEAARPGDIDEIVRLDGDRAQTTQRLAAQEDKSGHLLVAWLGDQAVGELYIRLERPEEPDLFHLWPKTPLLERALVAEGYRRQGIGTQLMTAAERWLAWRHYRKVALAVMDENEDARRLYQALGYKDYVRVLCRARGAAPDTPADEKCAVMVKKLSRKPVSAGSTA